MDSYIFIDGSGQRTARRGARRFFALIFIPLIIASCVGSPPQEAGEGVLAFMTLVEEQGIPLFPDDPEKSPRLRIFLSLSALTPAAARDNPALEALIRENLYGGLESRDYREALVAAKRAEYLPMREETERGSSLNWEYRETIEPLPPDVRFLVFSRSREYYLGGAHGMQERKYFTIDREKGALLALDDLIRPDARPRLAELLAGALRSEAGLDEGAPLSAAGFFEDTVEPPENFFPGPGGLGFQWDPYEIAPYVMGPLQAVIPWGEARALLAREYWSIYQ